jgi:hypothetical protein
MDPFAEAHLSRDAREQLLVAQDECTVGWINDEGWPICVVQTYVWTNGSFWLTAFTDKPRVRALTERPQSTVSISSKGTDQGPERMVSCRTRAVIHTDDETKSWFYPEFAKRTSDDPAMQAGMAKALSRQDRVVIELQPVSWNTFDGIALRKAMTRPRT